MIASGACARAVTGSHGGVADQLNHRPAETLPTP